MNKIVQLGKDGTTQLPDWVLANLGVVPGDLLEFEQQGDSIIVRRKTRDVRTLIAKHARTTGSAPKTEQEFLEQIRAERGWDHDDEMAFEKWEQDRLCQK